MHNINQDILISHSLCLNGVLADKEQVFDAIIVNRDDYFQQEGEKKRLHGRVSDLT